MTEETYINKASPSSGVTISHYCFQSVLSLTHLVQLYKTISRAQAEHQIEHQAEHNAANAYRCRPAGGLAHRERLL